MFLGAFKSFVAPEYSTYQYSTRYLSNEEYLIFLREQDFVTLSPEELTTKRLQAKEMFLEKTIRTAIGEMISRMECLNVAAIFFYLHWRLYRKSLLKEESKAAL